MAGRGEEGDTPGKGTIWGKGPAPSQILYPVNSRPPVSKEVPAPAVNTKIHGCSSPRVPLPRVPLPRVGGGSTSTRGG